MRNPVDTIILDLDNTLFDWFEIWYNSFDPVYREILNKHKGSEADAQKDIRNIHKKARTSEYSFLLEDLEKIKVLNLEGEVRNDFSIALKESRDARTASTDLYPTVLESLWKIKNKGVKIVAYTESMGFYSGYRLKSLGLDGVIDVMFCPEDHDTPVGASVSRLRSRPEDAYELQVTKVMHTPSGELKPNAKILKKIIQDVGASISRCVYVGDSLFKDVAMARDCGVLDVHAKYGESQKRPEYNLLRSISHWTDEDVERERKIVESGIDFTPTITLKNHFSEIFEHINFKSFSENGSEDYSNQELIEVDKINFEIWKKGVEVHQHFNDLELRIRNYAITITGAIVAAIGIMTQRNMVTTVFGVEFPTSLTLVMVAIVVWGSFFLMDRYWYHVLLKGAVNHNMKVEAALTHRYPNISLGKTISEESSKVKIFGLKLNSNKRLNIFYLSMLIILFVLGTGIFMSHSSGSTTIADPVAQRNIDKAASSELGTDVQ